MQAHDLQEKFDYCCRFPTYSNWHCINTGLFRMVANAA